MQANPQRSSSHAAVYKRNALAAYKQGFNHKLWTPAMKTPDNEINHSVINTWIREHCIDDEGTQLQELLKNTRDVVLRRTIHVVLELDRVLALTRSRSRSLVVYRGIPSNFVYDNLVVNKGFTSTTTNLSVAVEFMGASGADDDDVSGGIVLKMKVPPGIGAYVYEDDDEHEHEVLLERNTQCILGKRERVTVSKWRHKWEVTVVECVLVKYVPPIVPRQRASLKKSFSERKEAFVAEIADV